MVISNFPMVSQRTTITSDGRVSEDALYECVPASIGAVILWLEGKSQWDTSLSPDLLKDRVYGESYTGGTSAARYVDVCKLIGYNLAMQEKPDAVQTVGLARALLAQNKPVIFTMLDPYVDTSLPQYSGWSHVCVFIGDDATGLTAMDPFIAQPVYKSIGTWASLLRSNEIWTVERLSSMGVPTGWHDDGTTLMAPNGFKVVLGFRKWVLEHNWDPVDWPLQNQIHLSSLEGSNPNLGEGDQQIFRWTMLGYTPSRGVFVEWLGQELGYLRNRDAQMFDAYNQAKAQIAAQQTQIQQLQAQLAKVQPNPNLSPDMQLIVATANRYIIPAMP